MSDRWHTRRDRFPRRLDPGLRRQLERMRYTGHEGGFISRHRALLFSPHNAAKMLPAALLVLIVLAVWYLLLDYVSRFWMVILGFWREVIGISGYTTMAHYELGGVEFSIPYLHFPSGLPTNLLWWIGALFTLVLVLISLLIPRRYLPIAVLLRIVAFFQACAQVFFAFWLYSFPYGASGYVHGMLIASLMLISLIPVVLGFTYYVFDFSLGRKIALTLLIMGHLTIMIPLQYMVHAYVTYHLSLLFLPLMFFIFGLPLNVFVFIAFFSWGFSWKNLLYESDVQWKIRRRFV